MWRHVRIFYVGFVINSIHNIEVVAMLNTKQSLVDTFNVKFVVKKYS